MTTPTPKFKSPEEQIVRVMNDDGQILEAPYYSIDAYINSFFAILPDSEQPAGFDWEILAEYMELPVYPKWTWISIISRINPYEKIKPANACIKMVKRTRASDQKSIYLRPLVLGFSIKEILLMIVPALMSGLITYYLVPKCK